jgi:hypothetical protein
MELTPLNALSPLDGRYQAKVDPLRAYFSEYALIKNRALVEVEWLKALAALPEIQEIKAFSKETLKELDASHSAILAKMKLRKSKPLKHEPIMTLKHLNIGLKINSIAMQKSKEPVSLFTLPAPAKTLTIYLTH